MLKIEFLGDSITEGVGASKKENSYPTLLCKMIGAEEVNYGLSGSRIARQMVHNGNPDEDFLLRIRWMRKDCDFLFIFGGTNDYGHGDAPLGKKGDNTPYTFYGAMRLLLEGLTKDYGFKKDQICVILPPHRFNEDSDKGDGRKIFLPCAPLKDYRKAEKEIADEFGIDTLEFKKLPQVVPEGYSEYFLDGLHPNDLGHKTIAEELYAYLKQKGILAC